MELTKDLLLHLRHAKYIRVYLDRLEEYAEGLLREGKKIEGFDLVPGRAVKKWNDEDDIVDFLKENFKEVEPFVKKLKSPSVIIKEVGRDTVSEFFHEVRKKVMKPTKELKEKQDKDIERINFEEI